MASLDDRLPTIAHGGRAVPSDPWPDCPLCGRSGTPIHSQVRDRHFGVPGTWSFLGCGVCGLAWLDPCPLADQIGKLYPNYYTHRPRDWSGGRLAALKRELRAAALGYANVPTRPLPRRLGRLLARVGPLHDLLGGGALWLDGSRRGCLLDIGCGSGEFLADMRDLGWSVTGVDQDADALRVAREQFGLDVLHGTLEQAHFPSASFDAISLSHVIEHVLDPVALLAECRRLLRPGGRLVAVTPNTSGLGRRLLGESWIFWDPPRHLRLFSPAALATCATRAGLRVAYVRTTARRAPWVWSNSRLIQRQGSTNGLTPPVPGRLRLEGRVFWVLEVLALVTSACGEEVVIEAGRDG